jgi:hypothetical protein
LALIQKMLGAVVCLEGDGGVFNEGL